MIESAHHWLESLAAHPACLACVVRPTGQGALIRSWDSALDDSALDLASRSALDMFRILKLHRLPSEFLQWTFQSGVMHCLWRPDGWVMMVLSRREPALPEETLASLGQAFMELR
jgi:hypothetical protein